ncbi:MAG: hypothetical protein HON10_04590 [Euryarchaeota archaeon]|jgi:hypothetical protein|nr:hypothetical protein [Euryarchaeota archaeon]MBT7987055.1 hypothetical protein [Euryarchaeota archaeon]
MFQEEAFVLPNSFEEDDIDIFAELGVVNNQPVAVKSNQEFQNENLAILLSDDDEAEPLIETQESLATQQPVVNETSTTTISDETITQLLEVLVKKELNSLDQESIISKIPTKAKFNLETAKVSKSDEEYELSVIIEVDGSGPLRPFAKVRSENNSLLIEPAPKTIPSSWIPLYEALRDMLAKAMQALSSTNFTINKNV